MPYRTRMHAMRRKKQAEINEDLTWQEIADELGISISTLYRYISEAVPRPDYSVVDRMARYFGVDVRELIYEVSEDEEDAKGQPAANAAR